MISISAFVHEHTAGVWSSGATIEKYAQSVLFIRAVSCGDPG